MIVYTFHAVKEDGKLLFSEVFEVESESEIFMDTSPDKMTVMFAPEHRKVIFACPNYDVLVAFSNGMGEYKRLIEGFYGEDLQGHNQDFEAE